MVGLTRPEGPEPEDFHLSRRTLAGVFFTGYALAARAAAAQPIRTDMAGLLSSRVVVRTRDSQMSAYAAWPQGRGRFPAVIVIPEVFGIHAYIRDICRRLAKSGYYAIAPDLFHRAGDTASLTDFAEIRKIVSTVGYEQSMDDIAATLAFVRREPMVDSRRLGITGFCWGGALVWLAAARFRDFRAGAAWYGRLTRPAAGEFLSERDRQWPVEVAHALHCPVLGLYAQNDRGIPPESVQQMRRALETYNRRGSTLLVYPDTQHGFHADYRETYNAAAAEDGWRRMLDHFRRFGMPGRIPAPARAA
jgi:carboxymethylenebutenolidase